MKLFELSERLGIPAFELVDRMSLKEVEMWCHYDNINVSKVTKTDYQYASLMAHLDWIKGVKEPDPKLYLPKIEAKETRKRSIEEIKAYYDLAVARSQLPARPPL